MSQKIIHGDCEAILPDFKDYFSVCVTSFPYNIGINYSQYDDNKPKNEYLDWLDRIIKLIYSSLKEDGSFFLNMGSSYIDPWTAFDVAMIARKTFVLQNQIIWVKSITIDKTIGQYKPVNSNRFINNNFEYVFHFTKKGTNIVDKMAIGVPPTDEFNKERWGADLHCRGNLWYIPYETIVREPTTKPTDAQVAEGQNLNEWLSMSQAATAANVNRAIITIAVDTGRLKSNGLHGRERKIDPKDFARWLIDRVTIKKIKHPALFPSKLAEMCIKLHGIKPDIKVLDPFVGTGSTLVAAKKLEVEGIGIEIDKEYVDLANRRLGLI